ncbi:MAG: 6-phospho-3-hexuloisomerase [Planctomycetota bacterium]
MKDWKEAIHEHLDPIRIALGGIRSDDTDRFIELLIAAEKIFVVGRGRTGYIVGTFAMRLMHLGFDVHVVGDCTTPRISEKDLLVACSGSSRVRMVLQMMQIARRAQARIAQVTYNPAALPHGEVDLAVHIPVLIDRDYPKSAEIVFHPLGTLFEQVLMLYLDLVVSLLMQRLKVTEEEMAKRHTNLE